MNGVHDLGGMDGFGPVVRERNEPVFHADWERQVFGMMLATMGQGFYNLDEIRHAIERMSPAHYLGSTYYEHWLAGLERILAEKGRHHARGDRGAPARVGSAPSRRRCPSAQTPRWPTASPGAVRTPEHPRRAARASPATAPAPWYGWST